MLDKVHHIGYWVDDLDQAIARQDALFGAEVLRRLVSDITGGPVVFVRSGNAVMELMERPGQQQSGVLVFDHVAYEVDDLDGLVERLRGQGVQFEQDGPVPNAGRRAIWTRAATSMGVRLQLIGD
jgi:catechol 2,3-dioxygenase-like lactoylglutathione lyase family enzyme